MSKMSNTTLNNWNWIKIFIFLDPKADSKIVQLDLLQVAVVFLYFYLSL